MKKNLLLTVFAAFFLTLSTQAQEVRQITLQEAIEIALENNYLLRRAENNLNLSEKSLTNEYLDFLPTLDGSLSGSINQGRTQVDLGGVVQVINVNSQSFNGSVNARLPLFNAFENVLSLKRSKVENETAAERLQRARETVIYESAFRFLRVLLDQQLLEIARENLVTSENQLNQIRAQVEVGSRPMVDQYNQEAQVANDELSVTQAENALELSKLNLIRHLQIDPVQQYEFVTPDVTIDWAEKSNPEAYDLQTLIDRALENRADYKADQLNINTFKYQLQGAKFRLIPTLSASASMGSNYTDRDPLNFGDQFFDARINKRIGLSMSIPLFSGWDRVYSIQSSQVNLKNAELELDNTRLQIIQEVTQAYTSYRAYVKAYDAVEKSLIASEKAFETQQERYNVGASTLIELSQAQYTYVQAQSNQTQELFRLVFQEKVLDYYLGLLTEEDIEF